MGKMARLVAKYKIKTLGCRSSARAEVKVDSSGWKELGACAQNVPGMSDPHLLHVHDLSVGHLVSECEAAGLIVVHQLGGAHTRLPGYLLRVGITCWEWRAIYPQLAGPSQVCGLMVEGASATIFNLLMATAGLSSLWWAPKWFWDAKAVPASLAAQALGSRRAFICFICYNLTQVSSAEEIRSSWDKMYDLSPPRHGWWGAYWPRSKNQAGLTFPILVLSLAQCLLRWWFVGLIPVPGALLLYLRAPSKPL